MQLSGVTVADMAKYVGVSKPTVYGWLRGRQRPTHERLRLVASLLTSDPKNPESVQEVAGKLLT